MRRPTPTALQTSSGQESGLLRGVQEDHRETGPEGCEPGGTDSGAGRGGEGPEQPTGEVRGSLQGVEADARLLPGASGGVSGGAPRAEEAVRDGVGRAQAEIIGHVRGAEGALRGECEEGDRQGRQECKGEREERGGICRTFATGLLNDFERALPAESTGSGTRSSRLGKR